MRRCSSRPLPLSVLFLFVLLVFVVLFLFVLFLFVLSFVVLFLFVLLFVFVAFVVLFLFVLAFVLAFVVALLLVFRLCPALALFVLPSGGAAETLTTRNGGLSTGIRNTRTEPSRGRCRGRGKTWWSWSAKNGCANAS